jgi:hypothetical protein
MIELICMLCPVPGTMVSFAFRLPFGASPDFVTVTVYLDNAKAVNKLLLRELDE